MQENKKSLGWNTTIKNNNCSAPDLVFFLYYNSMAMFAQNTRSDSWIHHCVGCTQDVALLSIMRLMYNTKELNPNKN